jgi:hypothetical protein
MAIYKEIYQTFDDDETTYCYHRITSITMVTNVHNIIEVNSYRTQKRREREKQEIESGSEITVYKNIRYITMPYVSENPIVEAYEYLKTLPEFEGSIDVFEDGQEVEGQSSDKE